jgi:hypothetical protein
MEIRVGVSGDLARRIEIDQPLTVALNGHHYAATVRSVLPNRRRETRTVDVILSLDNGNDHVRHGELVIVPVEKLVPETGFWLPRSALTESSRGLWSCYVADPLDDQQAPKGATHRLSRRELELLHQQEDRVYMRGTLADGELIVVDGLHRLVPGQRVLTLPVE